MECGCPIDQGACSLDYYGVLNLKRNCTDLEIKQAYKRVATRFHPEGKTCKNFDMETFHLAAEAYDVLSDPLRRATYDRYGEEGLKNGITGTEGYIEPYTYHGEPMRTYREFFGTDSPYADLLNLLTEPQAMFDFAEGRGIRRKEEPLVNSLQLTLKEIYFGAVKKMKIQRLVFVGCDCTQTELGETILTIPIKPGIPSGTRIVFPEMGDQGPSKVPADVVFIVEERPHEVFRRCDSNLHATIDVFLREALTGTTVTIDTIDDRVLRIPITSVITPDYRKVVPGEGLPIPENPKTKGNLILNFKIEFPLYMPVHSKDYVNRAFESADNIPSIGNTAFVHRLILMNKLRRNIDDDVLLRHDKRNNDAKQLEEICNS